MSRRDPVRRDVLVDAVWWQSGMHRLCWHALEDAERLAAVVRMLLGQDGPEPDVLAVARDSIEAVRAMLSPDRRQRWSQLRALWHQHGPDTVAPDQRVGIPNPLWDRLLTRVGASQRAKRIRLDAGGRSFPRGVCAGAYHEWWGWPDAVGAAYDDRLWAWGIVQTSARANTDLTALSPRLAWRSDGARWYVHPLLASTVAAARDLDAPPRLEDGPGYLLACIVDGIAELLGQDVYTGRDLAVLWGTMLLPLLALTTERAHAPALQDEDCEPDYMQMLPFYMLHPRVQSAIVVLDHLCTLLVAGDDATLHMLLADIGRIDADICLPAQCIEEHTYALIEDIATSALRRRATMRWNSGFGFKLFRNLLREVLSRKPSQFSRCWDQAVHGEPTEAAASEQSPAGNLAHRLREALGTALWYPGRPPYPGGPAAQQIVDLVWLRWTDRDFLV